MFKRIRNQRRRRSERRILATLIRTYNQVKNVLQNSEVKYAGE